MTVDTPTSAVEIKKTREHEGVHPEARGVNELYRSVDGEDLTKARRGASDAFIKSLQRGYNKTQEDELTIAFISYDEAGTLSQGDADFLADVIATFSDTMTIPLMPKLARIVEPEDGLSDPAYRSYRKSVERFLKAAAAAAPEMPIMGVIPMLGHEYVTNLMDLYGENGVRAYCLNFDRKRITASPQVNVLQPMMRNLTTRGVEDNVLFYGINLHPGQQDDDLGFRPAADFVSVGMGLDIVGGSHVSPKLPEEVFEEMEGDSEDEMPTFRLFNREEWVYQDIPLDDLSKFFPEESALDVEQVVKRCQQSPRNAVNRLQKVVNAEQKALAASDLRPRIEKGNLIEHVSMKSGVTPGTAASCQEIKQEFDAGYGQSGLSDF